MPIESSFDIIDVGSDASRLTRTSLQEMTAPRPDGGGDARREPAAGIPRAATSGGGGGGGTAIMGTERERERERARLATAHAALRVFVQWKLQETALMRKTIGIEHHLTHKRAFNDVESGFADFSVSESPKVFLLETLARVDRELRRACADAGAFEGVAAVVAVHVSSEESVDEGARALVRAQAHFSPLGASVRLRLVRSLWARHGPVPEPRLVERLLTRIGAVPGCAEAMRSLEVVDGAQIDEACAARIARTLTGLRVSSFYNFWLRRSTAYLSTLAPGLTRLLVVGCEVDDEGCRAIATACGRTLECIDLSFNSIGEAGCIALGALCARCTEISVPGQSGVGITPAGLRALVAGMPRLSELSVARSTIGDEGASLIAEHCPGMRALIVGGSGITAKGAAAIASGCPRLVDLRVANNNIGAIGGREIAERLRHLEYLKVNNCGREAAAAVASHLSAPGIRKLLVRRNNLGDAGAVAMAAAPARLAHVTVLDVRQNAMSAAGAAAIATAFPRLTVLDVSSNPIGDEGVRALSEGAFRSTLAILDAGMCGLTDAGARCVAGGLVGLSVLKLYDNEIGDDGVRVIARALPRLRHLNVSGNRLSGVSCYRIAEHLGGLSTLILSDNCLDDDEGVVRIAESCPGLLRLDVAFTSITERGVEAIATRLVDLEHLDVVGVEVSNRVASAAMRRLPKLVEFSWDDEEEDEGAAEGNNLLYRVYRTDGRTV